MAYEDLPNGFTGFNRAKQPGFVSAADELRRQHARTRNGDAPLPRSDFQYVRRAEEEEPAAEPAVPANQPSLFAGQYAEVKPQPYTPAELDAIAEKDRRWAWVEVDLSAIRHNTQQVKRLLAPGCQLMAVVKADAYGHGAVECAKASLQAGATQLAVATVPEALQLREAGIKAPLLILAQPPAESIPLLLAHEIMPTIYDSEYAIQYGEAAAMLRSIDFHRGLKLAGMFTHFATADCPETLEFQRQLRRFNEAVNSVFAAGINPGIIHAANSAAILRYPETHFDMVRLGISLYGFHPCPETRGVIDLRPAMSVHARITDTRFVPPGEGVSYGLHYRSSGSVRICTVPLGYADGLRRGLSGNTDFIMNGQYFPQVGNICMDQCMFEVDLRSYASRARIDPQVGDEVLIVGRQGNAEITIDEMAEKLGSIQHEIAIGFSQRMPRFFTR